MDLQQKASGLIQVVTQQFPGRAE